MLFAYTEACLVPVVKCFFQYKNLDRNRTRLKSRALRGTLLSRQYETIVCVLSPLEKNREKVKWNRSGENRRTGLRGTWIGATASLESRKCFRRNKYTATARRPGLKSVAAFGGIGTTHCCDAGVLRGGFARGAPHCRRRSEDRFEKRGPVIVIGFFDTFEPNP